MRERLATMRQAWTEASRAKRREWAARFACGSLGIWSLFAPGPLANTAVYVALGVAAIAVIASAVRGDRDA